MIPGFATFFNSCFSWWQNLKQIILPQRREGTRTITTLCLRPLVAKSKTGDPPQETKTRKQKILVPWCLRGKTQNKRARHKETKARKRTITTWCLRPLVAKKKTSLSTAFTSQDVNYDFQASPPLSITPHSSK